MGRDLERRRLSQRTYNAKRGAEMRAWVANLKKGPCVDCGRTFPPEAMDFDHVKKKNFGICTASRVRTAPSRVRILREIKSCDLICACCHRVRTEARRKATPKRPRAKS